MATIVGRDDTKNDAKRQQSSLSFGRSNDVCRHCLQGYKLFTTGGMQILADNMGALIIGNIVAFVVALLAIKFLSAL